MKSNAVCHFCCPDCSADYIGKTDRNLHERCIEHATCKNSAVYEHIIACPELLYITNLLRHDVTNLTSSENREYLIQCVENNTTILDTSHNWNFLLLKEALYIKRKKPLLNNGLKASKELFLFS